MSTLDNAIWLTGPGGTAADGTTTITNNNGYSTTVTATFTSGAWDATSDGTNVSDFGAAFITAPITANYQFSNPVEELSFTLEHVSSQGSTYDDQFNLHLYDETGNLIPADDVIDALSGVNNATVYAASDGSVVIEADNTSPEDIQINIEEFKVSQVNITFEVGPDGTQTGGAGISDFEFDIPPPDLDGDGIENEEDIDSDGDGIIDTEEGYVEPEFREIVITFNGDEWSQSDNNRWELRDPNGEIMASGVHANAGTKIITTGSNISGDYTFTVFDSYGDGLSGDNPAGYTIAVDGVVVVDSGPNPNFGSTVTETFTVDAGGGTRDTDGDGIADHLDIDSDNDGITDNIEAQGAAGYIAPSGSDVDGDGLDDAYDASDGWAGSGGLTPVDSDGDGIADYLDLDSDNDGITDNVEAQTTAGYTAPTGNDSDGDGLDDAYDTVEGHQATTVGGLTPVDTDGDGTADVLDTDSDNDGTADVDEAGHGVSQAAIDASSDSDGDGIADVVDDVDGWDVNDTDIEGSNFGLADSDDDTPDDGSGATPLTQDFDFRDVPCFTPGARILTPYGERLIEELRVGDLVLTRDSGACPIRWIGQSSAPGLGAAAPIRLTRNAIPGLERAITVSQQHRFLLSSHENELLFGTPEVLVAAKHLVDGWRVRSLQQRHVTYLHLMFDRHEVIYANGVPTESFFAGESGLAALSECARASLFQAFPKLRETPHAFGPAARLCLKSWEAALITPLRPLRMPVNTVNAQGTGVRIAV